MEQQRVFLTFANFFVVFDLWSYLAGYEKWLLAVSQDIWAKILPNCIDRPWRPRMSSAGKDYVISRIWISLWWRIQKYSDHFYIMWLHFVVQLTPYLFLLAVGWIWQPNVEKWESRLGKVKGYMCRIALNYYSWRLLLFRLLPSCFVNKLLCFHPPLIRWIFRLPL